jgi:uncharacterized protein
MHTKLSFRLSECVFTPFSIFEAILFVSIYLIIQKIIYTLFNFISMNVLNITKYDIIAFDFARVFAIILIFYFSEKTSKIEYNYTIKFNIANIANFSMLFLLFEILILYLNYQIAHNLPSPIEFNKVQLNFVNFFSIVIISPFIEEVFFRWYLIGRMWQNYSNLSCIFISSITFSLVHSGIQSMVFGFVFGIFLSFIYLKTKNIKFTLFFHLINNLIYLIECNLMYFTRSN